MLKERLSPSLDKQLLSVEKSARKLIQALSKRMLDEYSKDTQAAIVKLKEDLAYLNKMRD